MFCLIKKELKHLYISFLYNGPAKLVCVYFWFQYWRTQVRGGDWMPLLSVREAPLRSKQMEVMVARNHLTKSYHHLVRPFSVVPIQMSWVLVLLERPLLVTCKSCLHWDGIFVSVGAQSPQSLHKILSLSEKGRDRQRKPPEDSQSNASSLLSSPHTSPYNTPRKGM